MLLCVLLREEETEKTRNTHTLTLITFLLHSTNTVTLQYIMDSNDKVDNDISDVTSGIDGLKIEDVAVKVEGVRETDETEEHRSSEIALPFPPGQTSTVTTPVSTEMASVPYTVTTPPPRPPSSGRPPLTNTSTPTEVQFFTPMKSAGKVEWKAATPSSHSSLERSASHDSADDTPPGQSTSSAEDKLKRSKSGDTHIVNITEILSADSGITRCFVSCNYNVSPPIFTLFKEVSLSRLHIDKFTSFPG
jgi:hypothetical protein